jgi:dihydropteroate synthase
MNMTEHTRGHEAPLTINVKGRLMDFGKPAVMGILNATPDSFFSGSRAQSDKEIEERLHTLMSEGADMIDIGAYSSRPGADVVTPDEEMRRLAHALDITRRLYPDAIVSVDTFRADVARRCVEEYGAAIINDISGGQLDQKMFETVARLNVPYILMHMKGDPQNMQQLTNGYSHYPADVFTYFAEKVDRLHELGVKDIILDPGFGFSKTLEQNYELLACTAELKMFHLPVLVGVSRKSMIYRLLESTPAEALNGTTVVNTLALLQGAHILRVHDVRAAVEAVRIVGKYAIYKDV